MKKQNTGKKLLAAFILLCVAALLVPNLLVYGYGKARVRNVNELIREGRSDRAIVLLGCGVKEDGTPSAMLRERLETALALFEDRLADTIYVTGDEHEGYSEVRVMHAYLAERGVPEAALVDDPEGHNTAQSFADAARDLAGRELIVVTQRYHLYRALYLAGKEGMEAVGVAADRIRYFGQLYRDARELLARAKDYYRLLFLRK